MIDKHYLALISYIEIDRKLVLHLQKSSNFKRSNSVSLLKRV